MPTFGEKLYITLREKEISQGKMAKDLGVSQATISKYVSGKVNPRMDYVKRIAKYLGVSLEELLGDEENDEH